MACSEPLVEEINIVAKSPEDWIANRHLHTMCKMINNWDFIEKIMGSKQRF